MTRLRLLQTQQTEQEREDRAAEFSPSQSDEAFTRRLLNLDASPYRRLAFAVARLHEAECLVERCVDEFNAAREAALGLPGPLKDAS